MQRLILLAFSLFLFGCYSPIDPDLWKPLPEKLTLSEPLTFESKGVGKITLPPGDYVYWHQNKFGHYFAIDSAEIRLVSKDMFGRVTTESFKGGISLSNRVVSISVYQLQTIAEARVETGEVATFASWEQGDNDGLYRKWRGGIPPTEWPKLGLQKE